MHTHSLCVDSLGTKRVATHRKACRDPVGPRRPLPRDHRYLPLESYSNPQCSMLSTPDTCPPQASSDVPQTAPKFKKPNSSMTPHAGVTCLVKLANVGIVEQPCGAGLPMKRLKALSVRDVFLGEKPQRHIAARPCVSRFAHFTRAASTNGGDHPVGP